MKIELHNGIIYLTDINPKDMKSFIFSDMMPYANSYRMSVQLFNDYEVSDIHILRKYLYNFLMNASKEAKLIIIKGANDDENY